MHSPFLFAGGGFRRGRFPNCRGAGGDGGARRQLASVAAERNPDHATVLRPHGLVYFALLPNRKSAADVARAAQEVFRAAEEMGAKARIELAPDELKRAVNVWGAARPDFELMRRVKNIFDPERTQPRAIRGRDLTRCPRAVRQNRSATDKSENPVYEDYARCVHCGLCLNHCPTYRLWGREADSPRGRIRQMMLVDDGKLELGETFVTHMDRCLDCRACETVCPSGVEYGKLIEYARAQIEQEYRRPFFSRVARNLFIGRLLPYPRRIAMAGRVRAVLSTIRIAAHGARRRACCVLLGLADRERLMPAMRPRILFLAPGENISGEGRAARASRIFCGMRRASIVHGIK